MNTDITAALVAEHRLILRMLTLLEKHAKLTAAGNYRNYRFYLDGVEFIRNYADRYHHAKEEDILFEALVENGMPRDNSPVGAMLVEHDLGRGYVKAMAEATEKALAGAQGEDPTIAVNAIAYVELLREHISKEDNILYPLAERIIPEEKRAGIISGYAAAEGKTPPDFGRRYEEIVAGYEAEELPTAA